MHRLSPSLQGMKESLPGGDFGSGTGQKAEVPVQWSQGICSLSVTIEPNLDIFGLAPRYISAADSA